MSDQPSSLFRQEVLRAAADTHSGATLQITPVKAGKLTAFFALLAVAVLAMLVWGQYTKKERVTGELQPRDGVALIVATEPGVIQRVRVSEGQAVKAGQVIAEISHERFGQAGSTQALLERNLAGQRSQVQKQSAGQGQAHQAALAAVDQRMAQARRDQGTLNEEIALQTQQIASASQLVAQLQPLRDERIVSDLQFEQQRQQLLDQRARLQTLKRQLSATQADLAQAQDERAKLIAQHGVDQATLERDLLTLQQDEVQRQGARVELLTAPVDGVVSGLLATPGQSTTAHSTIASIVPAQSPLEAVLYVPSTAMGFIKPGQSVHISYDAFPYQRFGQYQGTVRSVSQTDVNVSPPSSIGGERNGERRALFMVRVALDDAQVQAYGTRIPLHAGHTLSADIHIDRRSLIRWMLDPLFAFSGRL